MVKKINCKEKSRVEKVGKKGVYVKSLQEMTDK